MKNFYNGILVKKILNSNNIIIDTTSIKNIIKMIFPESVYYDRKHVNNKFYRHVFYKLKSV